MTNVSKFCKSVLQINYSFWLHTAEYHHGGKQWQQNSQSSGTEEGLPSGPNSRSENRMFPPNDITRIHLNFFELTDPIVSLFRFIHLFGPIRFSEFWN